MYIYHVAFMLIIFIFAPSGLYEHTDAVLYIFKNQNSIVSLIRMTSFMHRNAL